MAVFRRYSRRFILLFYGKYSFGDYIGDECGIYCRTAPLLTTILSLWIYKKEKATRGLMAGSLLALVGVALVVYNGSFVLKISPLGDFLTLLAAFSWAFYSLIMRKMSNCYSIIFITRKIFFYGVLTILPAFLIHPWNFDIVRLLEPAILFNLLFLGVLASLICFVVWNVVLKQLGTIRASNLYLSESFFHSGRFCFSAWRTAYYSCFDGGGADIGRSILGGKKVKFSFSMIKFYLCLQNNRQDETSFGRRVGNH